MCSSRYILLLQRYLQFRYKPTIGKTIYARILLKLADLREVAESHQEFDLKLTEKEIREIQERLAQQTFSTNSDGSSDLPSQWRFHEHITSKVIVPQSTLSTDREKSLKEASITNHHA